MHDGHTDPVGDWQTFSTTSNLLSIMELVPTNEYVSETETKNRKEISFILSDENDVLPVMCWGQGGFVCQVKQDY